MSEGKASVLTINGGSSSVKFALYQMGASMQRTLAGKVDRIGLPGTLLRFDELAAHEQNSYSLSDSAEYPSAISFLLDRLEQKVDFTQLKAVGHRIVHGMHQTEPTPITSVLLDDLRAMRAYDPEHVPAEIALIEAFTQRYPALPQIACFDTAFHQTMPRVARLLPIPRRFDAMGIARVGFHGLSYAYLMQQLAQIGDGAATNGRIILAHLGNGASLAAIRDGRCIDTSMGFTPAGGLVMGTRSGDLDPGVAWYLMQQEQLTPEAFNRLINHESGLLGISETSSDMRDLLASEPHDERAAEAITLFCYQIKKWIGSYVAVLGGLDTLVFTGGIGEKASTIRARICEGLGFFGIEISPLANENNSDMISTTTSKVAVRVMHTDEEQMIAMSVFRLLDFSIEKGIDDVPHTPK